ncbi:MAG: 3'-5' exonuclease [Bacteroidales bacterium]|nr:3'-5' exonuclease [Bacteroidales bacterium]
MTDFAAIDFETANDNHTSVCAVGIVVVRGGEEQCSFYSLIHPTPNFYGYYNSRVHGLHKRDTQSAPRFPEVWAQVSPLIEGLPLVAHNKVFDEDCLKKVFACYQMVYPDYKFLCTYNASCKMLKGQVENMQLHTVAAYCGYIMMHHHNALDDARACAAIAKQLL